MQILFMFSKTKFDEREISYMRGTTVINVEFAAYHSYLFCCMSVYLEFSSNW